MSETRIDSAEFRQALKEFWAAGKKDMAVVLKDQSRLFVRDAAKFTPPVGKSPNNESWAQQKKTGEATIKRELLGGRTSSGPSARRYPGIFLVAEGGLLRNKPSERTVRLFARKDGTVYGVEKELFRPNASVSEMEAHHDKYRGADGRVSSAGARDRTIGRWKFLDKMVVSKSAMNRYLRHVWKKIGMAKSGWNRAAQALGAKLPSWVTRHNGAGQVSINLGNKAEMSITVSNEVGFIQDEGEKMGVIQRAMNNRVRAMQVQTQAIFDKLARKHNAK